MTEDRRARVTRETATEDRRARATRETATEDRRARATRETVTEDRRAREAIRETATEGRRARAVIRETAIIAEADRRDREDVREQEETAEQNPLTPRFRQSQRATEAIKTHIKTTDLIRETRMTMQRSSWVRAASLKRRSSRRYTRNPR